MEIDNYSTNSFGEEEQEEMDAITSINKGLGALVTEIYSNKIEDLSTYSLEELYNKLEELKIGNNDSYTISRKIKNLQGYLNMNLDEEEEIKTKGKIEKYQKEVESIDNKIDENKKMYKTVEAEIETRLDKESDTGELNNRFIKTFNDIQSQKDGKNNERIVATVVEKDGKEIGKEIRRNNYLGVEGEYYWECLFRDNDGNFFYKTLVKNDNTGGKEEESIEEISNLKHACNLLKRINNSPNKKTNDMIEIDAEEDLVEEADFYGIPEEIVQEYINRIKERYGKITPSLDENLKKDLGFDGPEGEIYDTEGEIPQVTGCLCFYIEKFCPNRFREIVQLLLQNMTKNSDYLREQYGVVKKTIGSIKSYGDSFYEYLKFCSPFEGSYIKKGISHIQLRTHFGETLDEMRQRYEKGLEDLPLGISDVDTLIKGNQDIFGDDSMLTQYFENFGLEPESTNLFSFLKENPQTLENLGGKEIKSINLSIDSGINFAFRGIIEMVKSRPDIEFPHLNENATELEKDKRSQQWKRIVKEYEKMLRDYIAKDRQENTEGMRNTFDKIFISTSQGTLKANLTDEESMPSKQFIQQFSGSEVVDYSDDDVKYKKGESKEIKMISDIENYVSEHPTEKILVCLNQHGSPDGSSGNGRTKEDWIRLANISPNVKIRSIRCYFGRAFTNKEIYEQQSSLSGFSNNTPTNSAVCEIIGETSNKNLGFHEMEIYTRLNFPISVSPLTESMEYTDWNTGEKDMRNIGLARNNDPNGDDIRHNDYSLSV